MRLSCPLGFILSVSLSDTLLVVFILGMVYEVLLIVPVGMDLSGLWEVLWAVFKVESLRRACLAFEVDLAGKLQ